MGSNPIGTEADVAIGEILVFSEVLTDSDRRLLEGYLAHKWGLAKDLAIGHEYRVTDGTLVGDAAWADAKFGKGIYFDGNDDGLSFADLDELDALREFAISIWFKRKRTSPVVDQSRDRQRFLSQCSADPMTILKSERRVPRSKSIWMPVAEAKTPVWKSKQGIQNNKWHHLVLTYSGGLGNLDLFIDGVKKTTWTQFSGPLDSSNTSFQSRHRPSGRQQLG